MTKLLLKIRLFAVIVKCNWLTISLLHYHIFGVTSWLVNWVRQRGRYEKTEHLFYSSSLQLGYVGCVGINLTKLYVSSRLFKLDFFIYYLFLFFLHFCALRLLCWGSRWPFVSTFFAAVSCFGQKGLSVLCAWGGVLAKPVCLWWSTPLCNEETTAHSQTLAHLQHQVSEFTRWGHREPPDYAYTPSHSKEQL